MMILKYLSFKSELADLCVFILKGPNLLYRSNKEKKGYKIAKSNPVQ